MSEFRMYTDSNCKYYVKKYSDPANKYFSVCHMDEYDNPDHTPSGGWLSCIWAINGNVNRRNGNYSIYCPFNSNYGYEYTGLVPYCKYDGPLKVDNTNCHYYIKDTNMPYKEFILLMLQI